jgi:hypothetical protein
MSSYTGRGHQTVNLVANQEFVVSKRCEFYIADSKKNYRILNKSTLKKLYPLHKEIIEKYILDENIDFAKEQDAIKLFGFLMKCI